MPDTFEHPSFLLINDEWSPTCGGISQFNRRFAMSLAAAGCRTACLVRSATPGEQEDARKHGIALHTAMHTPVGPNLAIPVPELLEWRPDVIVGHDVVSGPLAWVYAQHYVPTAKLVYVVHTAPSQNEPYKHLDAASRLSEREREIRTVAADADVVAAVGPLLTRRTGAIVGPGCDVLRLDPGMDLHGDEPRRPPANAIVSMVCRTTHIEPKGIDIAARAVAGLRVVHERPMPELRIRGAHGERCDELRGQLVKRFGLARDRIDVRAYTAEPTEIAHDLQQAAVFVMPSRVEGFGLAALEAIGLGTPVLVSARSGLAEILRHHLGRIAEPMLVPVLDDLRRDAPRWREEIERTLDNLDDAFGYAHDVRVRLAGRLRWDETADKLLSQLPGPRRPASSVR
jgi:glycosyltransferase involved in cell wall biosynthesis